MADISAEIAAFKNAVYGEDVRDAMVSLANKLNDVVEAPVCFEKLSNYKNGTLIDLDLVKDDGIYTLVTTYPNEFDFTKLPSDIKNSNSITISCLLVCPFYSKGGHKMHTTQLLMLTNGAIYQRFLTNNVWGSWNALSKDITTIKQACDALKKYDELVPYSSDTVGHLAHSGTINSTFTTARVRKFYIPDGVTELYMNGYSTLSPNFWDIYWLIKDGQIVYQKVATGTPPVTISYETIPIVNDATEIWTSVGANQLKILQYDGYKDVPDRSEIDPDVDQPHGRLYAFGDSTTYGQIGGSGGQSANAWPQIIGKALNMNVTNKGVGGQGLCKDWSTIQTNYITNLNMSDATLIAVAWAYNDSTTWASMNRGSYTSTDDTTVMGKYYTIMKQFQQKCPNAQVVLVTGFGHPNDFTEQFTNLYTFSDQTCTVKEFYDELEKMANLHGWPCINQAKGTFVNEFNTNLIGDNIHPTNDGYLKYGNFLAGRFKAIWANIDSLA